MGKFKIKRLRDMLIGAAITLVIVLLVPQVSAMVGTKNAVVTYSDIKVNIDGVPTTLTDLEGNKIEPIMLFDTVYVPLSPVARAFGKTSTYDDKSKTIVISNLVKGSTPVKLSDLNVVNKVHPQKDVEGYFACRILTLRRSILARPNMVRLISLILLLHPSTNPLLKLLTTEFFTAS